MSIISTYLPSTNAERSLTVERRYQPTMEEYEVTVSIRLGADYLSIGVPLEELRTMMAGLGI